MKGIIEIVLIAIVAIIVMEGFFLNVLIGKQVTLKQTAKEIEIIKSVNKIESVKKGLPYSLYYSFQEALKVGGYDSFSQVKNMGEFEKNISIIFDDYREELRQASGIIIPNGRIDLNYDGDKLTLTFSSQDLLTYKYSSDDFSFEIFDNPNTTVKIKNGELLDYI
jgi:hypothetical protein